MDSNSKLLVEMFKFVSFKGYIKGVGKSWGNIGLTFENEIGKLPDSKYVPDFNDIEIKCSTRFSHYPIFLFTVAFDSSQNEVIRLAEKYGHIDSDFPDKKVLFKKVTNSIVAGNKYNFFFEVNRAEQKIYLAVYSSTGELLEKQAYINFSTLKHHVITKLNKMAYIKASKKIVAGENYYRYYALALYKLKDFDTFLDLIDRNVLVISIISRISKSGYDRGRYRNKNIEFAISEECLHLLFDCYYIHNEDYNNSFFSTSTYGNRNFYVK